MGSVACCSNHYFCGVGGLAADFYHNLKAHSRERYDYTDQVGVQDDHGSSTFPHKNKAGGFNAGEPTMYGAAGEEETFWTT